MSNIAANLQPGVVTALYGEALLLADEARAWFDRAMGHGARDAAVAKREEALSDDPLMHWAGRHDPSLRIALSCESLRLTTRLMHIIAWLLFQRAITSGEVPRGMGQEAIEQLGPSPQIERDVIACLPAEAQRLINASINLYERVSRLDAAIRDTPRMQTTPVAQMIARLQAAL